MENLIDVVKVLLPFLAAVVPIIYRAVKDVPKTWIKTLFLSVFAGLMVYGLITIIESFMPVPQITILEPSDGSTIDCERTTEDGYCIHTVKGIVSSMLKPNYKIYIIIKERGGNEWWLSGGAVQQQDIVNNNWEQPWASFGQIDSPVKSYLLCAFLTTEEYGSTQKFRTIPSDVITSTTISIKRN